MHLDDLKGRPVRAAFYCRFGVTAVRQVTSYDLALLSFRHLAEHCGWTVAGFYADHGSDDSGRNTLLKDCGEGGIDIVVIRSILRFERNPEKLISLVDAFHRNHVGIYFEDMDLYTMDDEQDLLAIIRLGGDGRKEPDTHHDQHGKE